MVEEKPVDENQLVGKTRQEQRERRRAREKATIPQHGKSLAKVYRDAVSKRSKGSETPKQSG